jgi:NADH-quinone oxidoreductase subunit J
MEAILFYGLAAVLIVFSILTITARNPVRSAIFLISALLSIAGLFFLLGAELVGAVQVLVYVGGVMVLFLFVILLVSLRGVETERRASRQWKAGVALGVVLVIELVLLLIHGADWFSTPASGTMAPAGMGNTEAVGTLLYTTYLLPFEIASVLLLVAIVGAVVLAKREL